MTQPKPDKPQPLDYFNPMNRPKRRSMLLSPVLWIVAALLGLFLVTSVLSMRPFRYGDGSPRLGSQSNLRQIGQGILLYTNDFHGEYPDSFQTILENEDVTSSVFVSPLRTETPATGPTTQAIASQLSGSHLSYVYLGKGLTKDTVTPDTVVAYELLVSPGDGTNVLFGDGHVEYVDPKIAARIVAAVAAGQLPVTMPTSP